MNFLKKRMIGFFEELRKNNINCAVLLGRDFDPNLFYLTGCVDFNCTLFIDATNDNAVLFCTSEDVVPPNFPWEVRSWSKDSFTIIKKLVKSVGSVGLDFSISHNRFVEIKKKLSIKRCVDVSPILYDLRAVKDDREVRKIRKACKSLERIFRSVEMNRLWERKDKEAYYLIKRWFAELEVDAAFDPLVCYDRNSAIIHGKLDGKMCRKVALFDLGVMVEHYCSDATNTFVFDEKLEGMKDGIIHLLEELKRMMKDGTPIKNVCTYAETVMKELGFEKEAYHNFHALGHGVGLEVHEAPTLGNDGGILKKNMVVAVEPAIYVKGQFGLRIEWMFLVGKQRSKPLLILK